MDSHDLTAFLPDFLASARGLTVSLRQAISSLQANPLDTVLLGKAHIDAHSLKGEAKAMGYEKTGELSRLLEFYFKDMMEGKISLTAGSAPLLFGLLSEIQASLDKIEKTGNESDLSAVFAEFSEKTGIH